MGENGSMFYIVLGLFSFLLFFLYDINSVIIKSKLLDLSFFAGILLLAVSTGGLVISSADQIRFDLIRTGICGTLAVIFLLLLIYTLFFALPFKETYLEPDAPRKVYRKGLYALCRHPGVLMFIAFYLFLGLALKSGIFYIASVIFSGLNIGYVCFQDCWTFMKTFPDYGEYKRETPFLLPRLRSIKKCFQTISQ